MRGTGAWRQEVFFVSLLLFLLSGIGYLAGYEFKVFFFLLYIYFGWHGYQIYRLYTWLSRGKTRYPPDARGLWGDIFYMLFKVRKKSSRRQKEFLNIVSQFKASTSALPEGALVLSASGEVLWFNKSARELLGFHPAKDVGQRVVNLVRNPLFVKYFQSGEYKDSVEVVSPVNSELILNIHITPYKQGQRLMMVRDVTRVNQLEKVRKDFIANASHELRSPLTVIKGYLETISEPLARNNPRYAKPLQDMTQQAERMKTIVDDLLYLSKLENTENGEDFEYVNMNALMATLQKETQSMCDKKGHELVVSVESERQIRGNAKELHSAFSNLIFNAVRYTPDGGTIEIKWADKNKGAAFSVRDTGIGIEEKHIPRLTERFYRVDKGRAREVGGTGLGLAIVKHVLERHNGRLEVSSEPNQGSKFSCVFGKKVLR